MEIPLCEATCSCPWCAKRNWQQLSSDGLLTGKLIRQQKWARMASGPTLSMEFIRRFANHINWTMLCRYQRLSEDCIREFKNRVDWFWISTSQQLSEARNC